MPTITRVEPGRREEVNKTAHRMHAVYNSDVNKILWRTNRQLPGTTWKYFTNKGQHMWTQKRDNYSP